MFKGSYLFQTNILGIHLSFRECKDFFHCSRLVVVGGLEVEVADKSYRFCVPQLPAVLVLEVSIFFGETKE